MMKRTILHIATAVMMLAIFTACESEDLRTTFGGGNAQSIKLLLNAQGDEITRAVSRSDGNNAYGEDTIATADVFFYTADGTLLYDVAKENVTLSAPDANGVVTATVPMPSDNTDLTQAAKVYVMGNRQATDGQVADTDKSEAALRALTFTTAALAEVPTAETTFAMDGTGNIKVENNEISGTVELVRNAAKITLTVNLPDTLIADGKTYKPQTDNITVTFNEGVKTFGVESDVFDVEQRAGTTDNGNTPVTFAPFYSYPTTWKTGDDNEPYFTLHVPWGETNADDSVTTYKTYHYRVPINKTHFENDGKTLALNRNHWYQVSVNVGVLGTPEASDEVELTANYEVKPWGNLPIGANLLDFKYLVVDKHEVSIYNQPSASIAFKSSDDVIITINKIEYKNYAQVNTRTIRLSKNSSGESLKQQSTDEKNWTNYVSGNNENDLNTYTDYKIKDDNEENTLTHTEVELKKDAGNIVFYHEILKNTLTPHDIYITVQHRDNSSYSEQIKITQYPPIYIKGATSNGNVFVNEETDNDGSIYTDTGYHFLGSIISRSSIGSGGTSQNSNTNPNQYTMYVTVIEDYNIGDPRVALGTEWKYANQFDEDKNMIYYRPTRTDAANVMAPIFKIASSYARTNSITFENAQKRCASYQENGYPAGRWRIPTAAEMEFITSLWGVGAIPSIFNSAYWVADGRQYDYAGGNGFTNSTSSTTVRCVYDVWYWGDTQQSNALSAPQWAVETID